VTTSSSALESPERASSSELTGPAAQGRHARARPHVRVEGKGEAAPSAQSETVALLRFMARRQERWERSDHIFPAPRESASSRRRPASSS